MLTRRHLLSGIALGTLTVPLATRSALAITLQDMPKPLSDMAALRCSAQASDLAAAGPLPAGDHSALIAKLRQLLSDKIAAGANPMTAQEVAVCPICGCSLTVTAQAAF
ncbi:hypothetical protein ACFPL7_02875 [Dongia soli]|uniref:Secreted protein n=1 Tax=Dongia soli TaxID=600628 RepID=A0ABU5EHF6_9PROT|nr:hypothetical protein [Dongia soli]MDY0885732.1 hypothetical protein [Dongia soli]